MSKIVRCGVVGYGHIGRRHAAMIKGNPEAELVAVVDIKDAALDVAREEYPDANLHKSIEDMIADRLDLDVVHICTPNGHHVPQALEVLENKMHVVVEKPLGLTKASCELLIHKSLQVSRHVFCVKQNRYSPTSVWLKSLIDEEKLGEVFMVQLNCYWNRDDRYYANSDWKGTKEMDGGVLFTQFSHFIDIMYWLFGDVKNINSRLYNFNHAENTEFDDSGVISFDFEQVGMGSVNFSTSIFGTNMESSIAVIGSKGSVKISGQYMDTVSYCHVDDYEMPELPPANPPNDYGDYKGSAANHHYVIDNVINVILGRSSISTNALEGMKVVEIIQRMYGDL